MSKVDIITLTQDPFFNSGKNDYTIVNTKKIEIILSDQCCKLEKCPICKNSKFGLVGNKCSVIDLRKLKSYNIQKDSNVNFGDLNLLG